VTSTPPRELDHALDTLVQRFAQGPLADEAARARAEHADRTGRVFEEDEIYEARTVAFLEWYVLEDRAPDGRTPIEIALGELPPPDEETPGEQAAMLRALATSHHSLFAIEVLGEGTVTLEDMWGGCRFEVDERRRLHGVVRGDVVEARLIGWRGRVRFGRTFAFHPAVTRTAILAHLGRIRAEGGSRADGVAFVAALQVKALRWKHVDVGRVYAAERGAM
jgi:hypothetical protein